MSEEQKTTDYLRGLEAAVKLADTYAEENFRLASDTVLTDPVLSGRDRSATGVALSEQFQLEGHMHASMAHGAQHIAAAIRRLASAE